MNKTSCASLTVFIGTCFALILCTVAIAIPYWEHVQIGETTSYYGLWRGCFADDQYEVCHSLDPVETSMMIVRFLEILGAILLTFALLCRVIAHYRVRRPEDTFIWDGLLIIIAGSLMLAGTMVYGWITQKEMEESSALFGLDVSFAMCVFSGALAITTGILRILVEKKRKFSRYGTTMAKHQKRVQRNLFGNTSATNIALVLLSQQAEMDRQRSDPHIANAFGNHVDTLPKTNVESSVYCY